MIQCCIYICINGFHGRFQEKKKGGGEVRGLQSRAHIDRNTNQINKWIDPILLSFVVKFAIWLLESSSNRNNTRFFWLFSYVTTSLASKLVKKRDIGRENFFFAKRVWFGRDKILRILAWSLGSASTAAFRPKLAEKRSFKFYNTCLDLRDQVPQ